MLENHERRGKGVIQKSREKGDCAAYTITKKNSKKKRLENIGIERGPIDLVARRGGQGELWAYHADATILERSSQLNKKLKAPGSKQNALRSVHILGKRG